MEKGENDGNQNFLLFTTMFSTPSENKFQFYSHTDFVFRANVF